MNTEDQDAATLVRDVPTALGMPDGALVTSAAIVVEYVDPTKGDRQLAVAFDGEPWIVIGMVSVLGDVVDAVHGPPDPSDG